jgi:hypothetical protein
MDHIGTDVHKKDSQICILTERGELNRRHQDFQAWTRYRGSTRNVLPRKPERLSRSCAGVHRHDPECARDGHKMGTPFSRVTYVGLRPRDTRIVLNFVRRGRG